MKLLYLIFLCLHTLSTVHSSAVIPLAISDEEKYQVTAFHHKSSMGNRRNALVDPETLFHQGITKYKGSLCCLRRDKKEAARLFKLAGYQGHPEALFRHSQMHEKGDGVLQNKGEAIRLLRLSAERGFPPAQYKLGILHHLGGEGIDQDDLKAVSLLILASKQGHSSATLQLAQWFEKKLVATPIRQLILLHADIGMCKAMSTIASWNRGSQTNIIGPRVDCKHCHAAVLKKLYNGKRKQQK